MLGDSREVTVHCEETTKALKCTEGAHLKWMSIFGTNEHLQFNGLSMLLEARTTARYHATNIAPITRRDVLCRSIIVSDGTTFTEAACLSVKPALLSRISYEMVGQLSGMSREAIQAWWMETEVQKVTEDFVNEKSEEA